MADPQQTVGPQTETTKNPPREREDEKRYVLNFIEKSLDRREPFEPVWNEVLDNYLVAMPGGGRDSFFNENGYKLFGRQGGNHYGSRLKDTETHQVVESLAAQGIGLLLGPRDYLQAVPLGSDDMEKAAFLSRILMGVMESPNVFRTVYSLLKDSFIFGTSIMQVGWENRSRKQVVKVPTVDKNGILTGFEFTEDDVTYIDTPSIRGVDIFDFYPDPSGSRIQHDMVGVAKRFTMTVAEALDLAERGIYDRTGVLAAIAHKRSQEQKDNKGDRRFEDGINTERTLPVMPEKEMSGILQGFEYWGEVPWKPADGARNRVITVLEDEWVRSHINPYLDGNIPFKEIVMNPINGRFYGLSPAETIRFLQDSADSILMNVTDAVDLAVNGPMIVGKAFGGDPNAMKRREPRSIITARDVNQAKPYPVDLNVLQLGAQDLLRRKMNMREASGATNPLQAVPQGDRQTATEVSELVRMASQRIELMIQIIEKDDFPWLGRAIHSRLRQFATEGGVATLNGEATPFTLEDIDIEADARFVGSRHAMSRGQKFQTHLQMVSILSQNPNLPRQYKEVLIRMFEEHLEIKDARTHVERAAQVAEQIAAEQQTGSPGQSQPSENRLPGDAAAQAGIDSVQ